jgi:hypothetical protein
VDDRLTERFFSARGGSSRKAFFAATVLSLSPLLSGCVSAVDESSAFGFAQAPEPKSVEDAIALDAKAAEPGVAEGGEVAVAAAKPESVTAKAEAKSAPALNPALAARVAEGESSETAGRQTAGSSPGAS